MGEEQSTQGRGGEGHNFSLMHATILTIVSRDITKGMVISIGECGTRLQTFSAYDLVNSYLGFLNKSSQASKIENEETITTYTALKIKAYKALLLAFTGSSDIDRFKSAKFILECDDQYLDKLLSVIDSIEIYKSPKMLRPDGGLSL